MTQAIAYLGFDGNCAEAMRFYAEALNGKVEVMMSGADSPIADQMPKEFAHRILHARLGAARRRHPVRRRRPAHLPYEGIKGVSIAVDYATVGEAEHVFARLSSGGQVTMPMQSAFWATRFGMVVDKFGTPWIVNGEPIPV